MTLGEKRIRVTYNPLENNNVSLIKQKTAELIDLLDNFESPSPKNDAIGINPEFARLRSLAQTNYEQAAMWAVKAVTL
jgi:hypothetical protein